MNAYAASTPLEPPLNPGTLMGLGTLGRRGDSVVTPVSTSVPAVTSTKSTMTKRMIHRQRGLGSLPLGKKTTRTQSKPAPAPPSQLDVHAGHATQPPGDAPASRPRMAVNSASRKIELPTAMASSNQP